MNAIAMTGIPIEVLFSIIGALLTLGYLDIKRTLRELSKDAQYRTRSVVKMDYALMLVCNKLGIPYKKEDDDK